MLALLPLLFACLSEPPYGAALRDTAVDPELAEDDALGLQPVWTKDEAMDQLQGALDSGLPRLDVARESFLGLIAEGEDESCPGTTDFDGSKPLGCTSEKGYLYAGLSQYQEDDRGWALGGDFEIREPDGSAFHGAGHIYLSGDRNGMVAEFSGSWSHQGGSEWLDPGRSGMFRVSSANGELVLDGGLDLGGTYLHFDEVVVTPGPEEAVSGTIGIRDEAGAWWWLELEEDGCGELSFSGRSYETACVELVDDVVDWAEVLEQ